MSLPRSAIRAAQVKSTFGLSSSLCTRINHHHSRSYSSAPATIVDAGFWKSLVPKFLRKENRQELRARRSKDWNPATFFIVIFLCIGSMSIQMITMRNSFEKHMRRTEVRVGLLKEVVEKIQRGETVDVEKMLGTGEPKKEADWEEMLRAIEKDDAARKAKASKAERAKRAAEAQQTKIQQIEPHVEGPSKEPSTSKPKTSGLGSFF
ncbi:hypothetical protein NLU13_6127 [Sarocladium strictum]|uniref:Uncharacterized protein n=1 Tax=Sarocladium strictum TaxID=5046 RepID=A0AA39GFB1_SARSR|nr:hypothetical protein NLU13_6127 [Sarocladium strictum]